MTYDDSFILAVDEPCDVRSVVAVRNSDVSVSNSYFHAFAARSNIHCTMLASDFSAANSFTFDRKGKRCLLFISRTDGAVVMTKKAFITPLCSADI